MHTTVKILLLAASIINVVAAIRNGRKHAELDRQVRDFKIEKNWQAHLRKIDSMKKDVYELPDLHEARKHGATHQRLPRREAQIVPGTRVQEIEGLLAEDGTQLATFEQCITIQAVLDGELINVVEWYDGNARRIKGENSLDRE